MASREVAFDELLSDIVDNRGRSCPTAPAGIPLIATNCIRNELLYPAYENLRYVSEETYRTWFRAHPLAGDIIFVNKGTPGRVCLVPESVNFVIAQDMVAVRPDKRRVYPKYLFAALRSAEVQERIGQMHVGTMIPHFKKSDFHRLMIPVPDNPGEQRFIGDAYFALCSKIDKLHLLNRTLEDMAASLFRAWFVDFEPVAAKAEGRRAVGVPEAVHQALPMHFVDSQLGAIPADWQVERFDRIARNARATVPPGDIARGTPYIAMEHMPRQSIALDVWEYAERLDSVKSVFARGDVLFGKLRPYFHKVGIAPTDGVCSTELLVMKPVAPEWNGILVCAASSREFVEYASAAAEGTRMPRVSWDYLARCPLVLPPQNVARAFTTLLSPILERIVANVHEIRAVAALRDTLLPQLMSGAMSFPGAERTVAALV